MSQIHYPLGVRHHEETEREELRQTLCVPLSEHPDHARRLIMVRGCKLCHVLSRRLPASGSGSAQVDAHPSRRR